MTDSEREDIILLNKIPERLQLYGVDIKKGRCRGFCHNGHDYNMVVKDYYCYCFVCSRKFDIFDVVMWFQNCTFPEAIDSLAKPISFKEYIKLKKVKSEYQQKLKQEEEAEKQYWDLYDRYMSLDNIIRLAEPNSPEYAYAINQIGYVGYLIDMKL